MTAEPAADASPTPKRTSLRTVPPLALVPLAALAWWVVGFLPWLLDGESRDSVRSVGVSTVAVPLFAGKLSVLVLGAGVGGLAAGLTARLGAGSRIVRAGACVAGVTIALAISLIQSRSGISGDIDDSRVTNGLTVVVVAVTLVGLILGLLGLTGRVGLGFALAAVAGAAPVWLASVFMALGVSDGGTRANVDELSRWVGAAVLVAALVFVGLRPLVRALIWPVIVLIAWCIAPTITAAGYAQIFLRAGMGEMWEDHFNATRDVWQQAVSLDMRPLTPWVVAIVVAAGVSLWLASRSKLPVVEPEPSVSP